jgi:hypothetical protein
MHTKKSQIIKANLNHQHTRCFPLPSEHIPLEILYRLVKNGMQKGHTEKKKKM